MVYFNNFEVIVDNFEFDKTIHSFKLNGIKIPSVTQILDGAGLNDAIKFIPKEILDAASDLGTKVHRTTELFDNNTLDIDFLHPVLRNYLDQWIKFRKDYDFVPTEIELIKYHSLYKYAGIIDRIGTARGKLTLIDIKSGIYTKTHEIQLAGYEILYNGSFPTKDHIKQKLLVYISENSYKVVECKNPNDKNVFLSALTIHNYKRSK